MRGGNILKLEVVPILFEQSDEEILNPVPSKNKLCDLLYMFNLPLCFFTREMEYELDMKYLSGEKAFYKKSFCQENKHCHPCISENYPPALEGEQRKGVWENCSMELGSVSLDASY